MDVELTIQSPMDTHKEEIDMKLKAAKWFFIVLQFIGILVGAFGFMILPLAAPALRSLAVGALGVLLLPILLLAGFVVGAVSGSVIWLLAVRAFLSWPEVDEVTRDNFTFRYRLLQWFIKKLYPAK